MANHCDERLRLAAAAVADLCPVRYADAASRSGLAALLDYAVDNAIAMSEVTK